MLQDAGDRRGSAIAMAHLGGMSGSLGQLEEAGATFAEIERLISDMDDPVLHAEVELSRGHLELAAVRATGDPQDAARHASLTREKVQSLPPDVVAGSSDVRVAVRRLAAEVADLHSSAFRRTVRPL